MSIRTRLVLVLTGALIMTVVMVACGELLTTTEIVQTQKAQNKIDNATATAEVVIAAGGNPDDQPLGLVGEGSAAGAQEIVFAGTATAEAEQGIFQQSVGSAQDQDVTQGAAFEVPVPDGPAASGVIVVDIVLIGAEGIGFVPDVVKIIVGSTVKWENSRRSASSTASDPGQDESWDSDAFSKSTFATEPASFEHTFNNVGCFTYVSKFSGDTGTGAICVVEE